MATFVSVEIQDRDGNAEGIRHINLDQVATADAVTSDGGQERIELVLRMVHGEEISLYGQVANEVVVAMGKHTEHPG